MDQDKLKEKIRKTKLVMDYSKIIGDTIVKNRHTFTQRALDLSDMGLKFISIDIESDDVVSVAKQLMEKMGEMMFVGISGIRTQEQFESIKDTNVHFVSSPINPDFKLATMAHECGMVCILSGVSPKDINDANAAGADYVQIYPAISYDITTMKKMIDEGIFGDTKIIAAGGTTIETAQYWLNAGCVLVTLGKCLMGKDCSLDATDKKFGDAVQEFNQKIRSSAFEMLNNIVVCSRPPKKYAEEPKIWEEPYILYYI